MTPSFPFFEDTALGRTLNFVETEGDFLTDALGGLGDLLDSGNFPGGDFPGGDFPGGDFPGDGFPGGADFLGLDNLEEFFGQLAELLPIPEDNDGDDLFDDHGLFDAIGGGLAKGVARLHDAGLKYGFGESGYLVGGNGYLVGPDGYLIGQDGLLAGDDGLLDALLEADDLGGIFSDHDLLGALVGQNGALIGQNGSLIGDHGILIGGAGLVVGDDGLLDGVFADGTFHAGLIDPTKAVNYLIGYDGLVAGLLESGLSLDYLLGDGNPLLGRNDGVIGGLVRADNGILDSYLGDDFLINGNDNYPIEALDDFLFGNDTPQEEARPIFTGMNDKVDFNDVDASTYTPYAQTTRAGDGEDHVILADHDNEYYTAGETFFAGAGDDYVRGGIQNDVIDGGDGYDTIDGGAGDDIIIGGTSRDTLRGQDGNDIIYGDTDPNAQPNTQVDFSIVPGGDLAGASVTAVGGELVITSHGVGVNGGGSSAIGYDHETHQGEGIILHFIDQVINMRITVNGLEGRDQNGCIERGKYTLFDKEGNQIGESVYFNGEDLKETGGILHIASGGFYSVRIEAASPQLGTGILDAIAHPLFNAFLDHHGDIDVAQSDITSVLVTLVNSATHDAVLDNALVQQLDEAMDGSLLKFIDFVKFSIQELVGQVNIGFDEITDALEQFMITSDITVEWADSLLEAVAISLGLIEGYEQHSSDFYIARADYTIQPEQTDGSDGADIIDAGDGDDIVYGQGGSDELHGADGNDVLYGGTGSDFITGGAGDDVIHGEEGNDKIKGGDGDDLLFGHDGDEAISGGAGNDEIYGGEGNDYWLFGDTGNDAIFGGAGNDAIDGGNGRDLINGGDGDDYWLFGGNGNDEICGGAGNDALDGGNGADVLDGGDGDDYWLFGGNGSDLILGGRGEDVLYGGQGNDVLTGGVGSDRFIFGLDGASDGHDEITDFQSCFDQIDLRSFYQITSFDQLMPHLIKLADGRTQIDLEALGGGEGDYVIVNHSYDDLGEHDFMLYEDPSA